MLRAHNTRPEAASRSFHTPPLSRVATNMSLLGKKNKQKLHHRERTGLQPKRIRAAHRRNSPFLDEPRVHGRKISQIAECTCARMLYLSVGPESVHIRAAGGKIKGTTSGNGWGRCMRGCVFWRIRSARGRYESSTWKASHKSVRKL